MEDLHAWIFPILTGRKLVLQGRAAPWHSGSLCVGSSKNTCKKKFNYASVLFCVQNSIQNSMQNCTTTYYLWWYNLMRTTLRVVLNILNGSAHVLSRRLVSIERPLKEPRPLTIWNSWTCRWCSTRKLRTSPRRMALSMSGSPRSSSHCLTASLGSSE